MQRLRHPGVGEAAEDQRKQTPLELYRDIETYRESCRDCRQTALQHLPSSTPREIAAKGRLDVVFPPEPGITGRRRITQEHLRFLRMQCVAV